jgi:predicted RNA binding protein YcfA (HicA-like mRNA interferase family)
MKPVTIREADKTLKSNGYNPVKQESSHRKYSNGHNSISLPIGHDGYVSCGVWRSILKLITITSCIFLALIVLSVIIYA